MRKRQLRVLALAAVAAMGLAACGGDSATTEETTAPEETVVEEAAPAVKVGVVYLGVPGDGGWTFAHEQGILQLESELGIEVTRLENVPEGADAVASFEQLARDGYNLIIGTSFGYMDPMLELSAKYPDVCFQHVSGYKTSANMGNLFGAMEEARYLSGIVAGKASESGTLGYVAAFPIPEVVRGLNAFTLGARSVNPDATVQVAWTSTWFDPAIEKEAAESLLQAGVDVLGMHQDSTAVGEAAQAAGAKWVGYNTDTKAADFDGTWLTAPVWNWGPRYVALAQAVAEGSCPVEPYYGSMADGMINLGVFGSTVDDETKALVEETAAKIKDGSFAPFTGPINDNAGTEQIAAGAIASLEDLLGQSYLVDGVIGKIE